MTPNFDKFINSVISEGVHFSVADTTKKPEDIGSIVGNLLYGNVANQFIQKNFTKEELENWRNEKMHDYIAADGDSYFKTEGTINFYTLGFPERLEEKFVSLLKYYIGENDAEVGNVVKNKSNSYKSDVYRIPVKMSDELTGNAPEMHLANANARALMSDVLGYESDVVDEYPRISVQELLMKIGQAEDNYYQIAKGTRPDEEEGNFYSYGLDVNRIKRYLEELRKMCEWAIENDYSYIQLS